MVAEIALSVMLLTGAGLLIRSFQALGNVELGFKPERVLLASTSVPGSTLEDARKAAAQEVVERAQDRGRSRHV